MQRRWIAATLAALMSVSAPAAAQSAPLISVPDEPSTWRERAVLLMDHQSLGAALRDHGYYYEGTDEIYLAEIVPGVGQPALIMYDAGQGAFSLNFWPASSVKLLASLAALEFAGSMGYTGDAVLSGPNLNGRTIRSIYETAIIRSDNYSYDLLMRIAGIDYVNQVFVPATGLGPVTIGSDLSGLQVLSSPSYTMTRWMPVADIPISMPPEIEALPVQRTIPARSASRYYRSNNIDLFDLGELVRRVMLHEEVPGDHRFALAIEDLEALQAALCVSEPAHYRRSARLVFGDDAVVCGKSGWWEKTPDEEEGKGGKKPETPPPLCIDVALLSDPDTGRRLLLAATGGCGGGGISALVGPAIAAAAELSGTPLQVDGGIPVAVELSEVDGSLVAVIETGASGAIVQIDRGAPVVASRRDGHLEAVLPMPAAGPHLLLVTGLDFGVRSAYRAVDFVVG